jgi:heme exporter protein C
MSSTSRAVSRPGIDWFLTASVIAVLGALTRAIFFTPVEARQGPAQKIFYVHVPSAFVGLYIGFAIVAIVGVLYLWLRDERLDRIGAAAVEVSLVYLTIVLLTGPLWGRPVWGAWWAWEARLTLTLFMWFVFVGYLILRGAIDDHEARARYSAVLGILGGLLVPFVHLSVYLFRTLHPLPILLKPGRPSLPGEMLLTFAIAMTAFTMLFFALLRSRYRLAMAVEALDPDNVADDVAGDVPVRSTFRAEPVR